VLGNRLGLGLLITGSTLLDLIGSDDVMVLVNQLNAGGAAAFDLHFLRNRVKLVKGAAIAIPKSGGQE
jgi:hypothetical protein